MPLREWFKFPLLVRDFLRFLWQEFKQDGCRETAAALTYTTLFAIVPVMTVTFTILRSLPRMREQGQSIQDWIFGFLMPSADAQIQEYLQSFAEQAAHLTGIGVLFLVVTSVLMLMTVETTMNRIWKVTIPRKGLTSLLMYWAVLTLGPLCLGVGLGVSSYVASLSLFKETAHLLGITHVLLVLVPVLFSSFLLTLLYIIVPNCHVPIRKGIIGGVVAAVFFELAKGAFVQFIKFSPSYQLVYGAFAAVPLFLLWIYVSWMIVLGGAELVRTLVVFRETRQRVPRLQALLRVLETLWLRQQRGEVLEAAEIRNTLVRAGSERWDEFRNLLLELGLIQRTDEGSYVLTRDLSQFSLAELVRALPWSLQDQLDAGGKARRPWEAELKNRCDAAQAGLAPLDITLAQLFVQAQEEVSG